MTRFPQPVGERGSLKWIQRAVQEQWPSLNEPILRRLPNSKSIEWVSPLKSDEFAEYRDDGFLKRLRREDLCGTLKEFWPARGPQWDALGLSDKGDLLLIEAKAHIEEMCSSGTAAGATSRERIAAQLDKVALELGARAGRAAWTEFFYQLANRLAHLAFLRSHDAPAYLVLVNFVGDGEMEGPTTPDAWRAAYQVAYHVMGLPKRHALSPFIVDVYPEVA
jgi:hypothetical protein